MKTQLTLLFCCIGLSSLIFCGCSAENRSSKVTSTSVERNEVDSLNNENLDFSEFEYKLPQSQYSYKIKITDIQTKIVKEAFTTKNDEYSVAKKVDGYLLTIKYAMTNPYDQEMMVPVPDYYYISSSNKEWFSSSTTFHRACQCDIDNSVEVKTSKGERLWSISDGKCGYGDWCVKFKPKETKKFILKFSDPIYGSVRKLLFHSFNRKWNNPEYTSERENALIIDVDRMAVVGERRF